MALILLQLDKIQFLNLYFPFETMSLCSRVQYRYLVAWNIHTNIFLPISLSSILLLFYLLYYVNAVYGCFKKIIFCSL